MTLSTIPYTPLRFGMWPGKPTIQVTEPAAIEALKAKMQKISEDKFDIQVSGNSKSSGSYNNKINVSADIRPKAGASGAVRKIHYDFHGKRYYRSYNSKGGTDKETLVLETDKQKFVYRQKSKRVYHTAFAPAFVGLYNKLNALIAKREQERLAQAQQVKELKSKQAKSVVENIEFPE